MCVLFMATELGISDLAGILSDLKEVSEPYQLGIQLEIDPSVLDTIERNHPRDIDRQKTEVIKHWLHNSPTTSCKTLAKAVEGLGGYKNLVKRLRAKGKGREISPQPLHRRQGSYLMRWDSFGAIYLETCVGCEVLILGKMGHGKSTLGNRMLSSDGCFKINSNKCPQTCGGTAALRSATQRKDYKITVYDHDGLFEGASSINSLSSDVPEGLNLVVFVLKRGNSFNVDERDILKVAVSEWKISRISALVLTHCECLSVEEREKMIKHFKEEYPSIAEIMGKGIHAVGFPDSSHIQPGSELSDNVEEDEKKVRRLIYSSDERVIIPQVDIFTLASQSQAEDDGTTRHSQNENRRCFCCSIL